MSIGHDSSLDSSLGHVSLPPAAAQSVPAALHRIAYVRRREGISMRSAARRLRSSIEQVRQQEEPSSDMLLSELLRWGDAFDVPLADLLVESGAPLSEPIMARAQLLSIMKTVRAIKETASHSSVQRFVTTLEQQLLELMPELNGVMTWPSIGQPRSADEWGRAAERALPDALFRDSAQ